MRSRRRGLLRIESSFVRSLLRLFLPYDLYERHTAVFRLLQAALGEATKGIRILDVGGRAGLLERFVPYRVISINMDGSGHLAGSGFALPFTDGSFDAVVSIDTLEHIPRESRLPFLRECWRVARQCIIVAAPFGSVGHTTHERRLDSLYRARYGESHVYLGEHIQYGLPDTSELDRLVRMLPIARSRRFYAGDYMWQGKHFERIVLWGRRKGMLARIMNNYNRVCSLALFHPVRLKDRPATTSNRFYWLLEKM